MNEFGKRLETLKMDVPNHVTIVAVSKTKPIEELQLAYDAGQRIFGENKVQEILRKQPQMPDDVQWHMIGHLQSNKVKMVLPMVSMIHAVDSLKLLKIIQQEAAKIERKIHCLIQIHVAQEDTKFGFTPQEAVDLFHTISLNDYPNIVFSGLMGMASFVADEEQVSREFNSLSNLHHHIKKEFFADYEPFKELSMGMTGDYKLAIAEGSTMIRVGTLLFGARNYG